MNSYLDSCGIPLVVVWLQDVKICRACMSLCEFSKLRTSGRKCGFGSFDCKYNWNLLSYSISSGPSFKNMGPWPLLITWKHTFEFQSKLQINFTWKMPKDEANGSTCWMQMHKIHNVQRFFRGWIVSPMFSFPICQGAARDSSGSSTASISSARASWLASSLISNHQQFHQKTLENCQLSVKSRASILSFSFELKRVSPASIRSWLPVWTQKITLSNLTKNETSIWWFEKSSKYENLKKKKNTANYCLQLHSFSGTKLAAISRRRVGSLSTPGKPKRHLTI